VGLQALASGAVISADTAMAAIAVILFARRTFSNAVHSELDWAPATPAVGGGTPAAAGMERALTAHPGAVVLVGSAPTALVRRRPGSQPLGGILVASTLDLAGGRDADAVGVQQQHCQSLRGRLRLHPGF